MSTNIGNISVELLLDIKPFAEGIKIAISLGNMLRVSLKDALSGNAITFNSKDIDASVANLNKKLTEHKSKVQESTTATKDYTRAAQESVKANFTLGGSLQNAGLKFEGFKAILTMLTSTFGEYIKKYNEFKNATLGLESVAKFKGIDTTEAVNTVKELELVKNGLLSVGDASTSMKNLLSANFTMEQSVELLKRLGDAAAFGRQGSLEFGEAVRSATEGIKNGNSILVDNAGVTKNLSVMLQEAGFSAQDMMNASGDAGVRMAIFNGILKETNGQVGDSGKLMNTSQGETVKFSKAVNDIKIAFGELLSSLNFIFKPISEILKLISTAPTNVKVASLALSTLAIAFIFLNGSINPTLKTFAMISALMIALPPNIRVAAGTLMLLVGAMIVLNGSVTILNISLGGLPIALGLIATAIVGITSGLTETAGAFDTFTSKLDSIKKTIDDYSESINKTKTNLADLELVYNRLTTQSVLTDAEQKNYEATLGRITAIYPQILSGTDAYTNTLTTNKQAVEELIAAEKEKLLIQQNARNAQIIEGLGQITDKYASQIEKIAELKDRQQTLNEAIKEGGLSFDEYSAASIPVGTLYEQLDKVNSKLGELSGAEDIVKDEFMKFIEAAKKTEDIDKLINQMKNRFGETSAAAQMFFNILADRTKQAINNWYDFGNTIKYVKGLMASIPSPEHTVERPTKDIIDARIAEYEKKIGSEPDTKKIAEYQAEITALGIQKNKLLGIKTNTGSYRGGSSHTSSVTQEKDAVQELIQTWTKQIDIYYTAEEFQSKIEAKGKSLTSVFSEINNEIATNTALTDDQVLALVKYRDTVLDMLQEQSGFKKLFAGAFKPEGDPDELARQFAKERMDWYNQYGSKDKRYKPLDETKEYVDALRLIKDINKEKLTETELQKILNTLLEKESSIVVDSEKSAKLKKLVLDEIRNTEAEILSIKKSQFDLDMEIYKKSLEFMDNEYDRRRASIYLDYMAEINRLELLEKEARTEEERDKIKQLKKIAGDKARRDSKQADKDEMIYQGEYMLSAYEQGIQNVQTIARMFGESGRKFAESFQQALNLAQAIKAVLDSVALIKGILQIFGLFSTGGASAAVPVLHDGGILAGANGADIPIIAQEGEGILSRAKTKMLASFSPSLYKWMFGGSGSLPKAMNYYHTGGIVAKVAEARNNTRIIEVPYIQETAVSGSNLKIITRRQDKIDKRRIG